MLSSSGSSRHASQWQKDVGSQNTGRDNHNLSGNEETSSEDNSADLPPGGVKAEPGLLKQLATGKYDFPDVIKVPKKRTRPEEDATKR